MSQLTVPSVIESSLVLGDGSSGASLPAVLQFDQDQVPNLYSVCGSEINFSFEERGVAYHEQQASSQRVDAKLSTRGGSSGFSLQFDGTPVEKWGINFGATVRVKHEHTGDERVIYLPGTRTYDPAGITGDPHASERIGTACSRTQVGLTASQLVAALKGAELTQINHLQDKLRPLIMRYHGRGVLFDWMKLQIEQAVYINENVTPYPEYIKKLILMGKLELGDSRKHTRLYLQSYNEGNPRPPPQFYKKVASKDQVDALFSGQQLSKFQELCSVAV